MAKQYHPMAARIGITPEQYAAVLREERDLLVQSWQSGIINSLAGVEALMNARIRDDFDVETVTGDAFDR